MPVGPVNAGMFCPVYTGTAESETPEVSAGGVVPSGTTLVTGVPGASVSAVAGVVLVTLTADNTADGGWTMIRRDKGECIVLLIGTHSFQTVWLIV